MLFSIVLCAPFLFLSIFGCVVVFVVGDNSDGMGDSPLGGYGSEDGLKEWSFKEEGHMASPHWAETAAERKVGQGHMVEAQRQDGK